MSKPTGLPDCPIQVREDAANMDLNQEKTSTSDLACWQEGSTLGSRHEQSTSSWGNLKALSSKPREAHSIQTLKIQEEFVIGDKPTSEINHELFSLVPQFF